MTQTLSKTETQDFIKLYYSNPHNARFEQMIQECKQSVIQSIVIPFGLGKIIAAYDKVGGNVIQYIIHDKGYMQQIKRKKTTNKEANMIATNIIVIANI